MNNETTKLHAEDEGNHSPDETPDWQESWYFNWQSGADFGLARIGYKKTFWGWSCDALIIATRNGVPALAWARLGIPLLRRPEPWQGLAAGGFRLHMEEPYKRWHIRLTGMCELSWQALAPPHDFGEGAGPPGIAPRHFEQCGTVQGWLRHGTERIEIKGLGQRDKSWGQRSWAAIAGWEWVCVPVSAELGLHLWTARGLDGKQYGGGLLRRKNILYAVDCIEPSVATNSLGAPQSLTLTGRVQDSSLHLSGTADGIFPLAKSGLWIDETAMHYCLTVDGTVYRCRGLLEHAYHVGRSGYLWRLPLILKTLTVLRP